MSSAMKTSCTGVAHRSTSRQQKAMKSHISLPRLTGEIMHISGCPGPKSREMSGLRMVITVPLLAVRNDNFCLLWISEDVLSCGLRRVSVWDGVTVAWSVLLLEGALLHAVVTRSLSKRSWRSRTPEGRLELEMSSLGEAVSFTPLRTRSLSSGSNRVECSCPSHVHSARSWEFSFRRLAISVTRSSRAKSTMFACSSSNCWSSPLKMRSLFAKRLWSAWVHPAFAT
mmetsp:Transcript_71231/g.208779  ORF Transcript_71231/g.208779 Transcript_71231/m.208779 type:complete len:227 (-) Transcript_71231:245-925(-)